MKYTLENTLLEGEKRNKEIMITNPQKRNRSYCPKIQLLAAPKVLSRSSKLLSFLFLSIGWCQSAFFGVFGRKEILGASRIWRVSWRIF
jgi:hypothetical protein